MDRREPRRPQAFHELLPKGAEHPVEKVGKELRAMMPWISAGKQSVADVSGGGDV